MYIPPHIIEQLPIELGEQWNSQSALSLKKTMELLDSVMEPKKWRDHIHRKYNVTNILSLANRRGMNRGKLAKLLRLEFPQPWVFTMYRYEQEQRAVHNVHEWLRPAAEVDLKLARFLWKHRSKFSGHKAFTLPPVEPNKYPVLFKVDKRWFYAGKLELFHKGRGKEPAMSIFLRALEEAKEKAA